MTDLRQRLAAELAEADPCCGSVHSDDYANAALAVFADWLRERADAGHPRDGAAGPVLRLIAVEIAPKERP